MKNCFGKIGKIGKNEKNAFFDRNSTEFLSLATFQ